MSLFGYPESNICIAPSGVELARFQVSVTREDIREKLGIHTNLPIALYIGALETWKGYQVFLEASRQYVGQVQYVVIGGNEAVISSLKEKYPHVLFLGFLPQKDLPHTQQVADVLVVPNSGGEVISERYTSPLKVFAHMASGIPIVASGTTALREVLNETNALLVPPDDAKALGEGIKHVLTKETESLLRAGRALNDVQSYDWSVRTATIVAHIEHAQHRDGVIFDSEIV
jgi:glycosyltransferase involved in cell wall biosynthesis